MSPVSQFDTSQIRDSAITTDKLAAKAVTLAKMADLAAGKLILGDGDGRPAATTPTGDVTITNAGATSIGNNKVVTAMINAKAVTLAKMDDLASGKILVGNGSNRPAAVTPSGDVTIGTDGAVTIAAEAITLGKMADLPSGYFLVGNGSNRPDAVTMSGDASMTNAGVVAIASGVIVNADVKSDAAIAESKLADLGKEGAASLLANIQRRYRENFNPYILSGLVPSKSGNDISITAGLAYPYGARVSTSGATVLTGGSDIPASQTAGHIYVDSDGTFHAIASGSSVPATAIKLGEYNSDGSGNATAVSTTNRSTAKVLAEAQLGFDASTGHSHDGTDSTPVNYSDLVGAPTGFGSFADGETPSNSCDGENLTFGLAHAPSPAGSLILDENGAVLKAGSDYTLNGSTITFEAGNAPPTGSQLTAWYRY